MPIRFATAASSSPMTTRRCQGSPGLIVVPQSLPIREVVDALILIWAATQPEEWINRVAYLPICSQRAAGDGSRSCGISGFAPGTHCRCLKQEHMTVDASCSNKSSLPIRAKNTKTTIERRDR